MSNNKYESELLKFSTQIKNRFERMSRRYKVPLSTIYEDFDVVLSDSSEHFLNKSIQVTGDPEDEKQ